MPNSPAGRSSKDAFSVKSAKLPTRARCCLVFSAAIVGLRLVGGCTIRRVADHRVEAAGHKDSGKFGLPVECVDPPSLLFVQNVNLAGLRRSRADQRVAALDVVAQVGQRPLVKNRNWLAMRLADSPSNTFNNSESFVTSTAWGSMSTP